MHPDAVILLIVLSFVLIVLKLTLSYFKAKERSQEGKAGGSSLKTSELKALVREAVEEANTPLVARIEALEGRLETPALPRHAEHEPQPVR